MSKKRFSEEQIIYALKQAEGGRPVREVCRELGVSEPSFYAWRKKYGGMGVSELRELRQLREENRQLKGLVADLTLDKHILQDVLRKKSEAGSEAGAGWSDMRVVRHRGEAGLQASGASSIRVLLPELCSCADRAEDAVARAGDDAGTVWL
jgi:putative transposase